MGFKELLKNKPVVLLDGASGSNLFAAGMPVGVCPEKWVLDHPDIFKEIQKKYIEAGSDVLYSMTFGCNPVKLAEFGLQGEQNKIIREMTALSRQAIEESGTDREICVLGDISMTGRQVYPIGDMGFEELVDVYKSVVKDMEQAGVDGFAIETMMSLQECRAALLAVRECSELPAIVTLTFESGGRTLFGTEPKTAISVLQAMGADAVGMNCSTGPEAMLPMIRQMLEVAKVPVVVKPNAGLPALKDGKTVYEMEPDEFGRQMEEVIRAGVRVVGGCCGTDERHIRALAEVIGKRPVNPDENASRNRKCHAVLTGERNMVEIDPDGVFIVVGERINPTGKKALQEELRNGSLEMVLDMAQEQVEKGARVLDVNMGMSGIDEKEMMCRAIDELTMVVDVPLSIDSSDPEVIEAALRRYPGRALINSISLEPGKAEKLLPLAKKYGAVFILLPLTADGLPRDIHEKHEAIDTLVAMAKKEGLGEEDIVVDGLVATVGANKNAALEVLETVRYCKNELHIPTICGLSNISFGLPERVFINTAFLTMAIGEGLTMAIANPGQTLLMNAAFSADLLCAKEGADTAYIEGVRPYEPSGQAKDRERGSGSAAYIPEGASGLFTAVMKGKKGAVCALIDERIGAGENPDHLIDHDLIPAISRVGELYEKKIFFLPQLIAGAEAMEEAVSYIEPMLGGSEEGSKGATIVMATVRGDVHDIGKNLVVLLLKNYGYQVIDLGKDVETETIIEAARENDAAIIGLSALMTTTMTAMADVVRARNEAGLSAKVIIGGACVTEEYADEIGADGYSEDAREAVKLVEKLLQPEG